MTRGWDNQTTKQVGEYTVAGELSRLGFMCTPFAGNVPHYDIIAADPAGRIIAVQVKAIRGGSWQFDIRRFVSITLDGTTQIVGELTNEPYRDLWCIFVLLGTKRRDDRFFIFSWKTLQDIAVKHHRAYLQKHGGVRPKRHDSYHAALTPLDIVDHEEKWEQLKELSGENEPGSILDPEIA